MNPFKIFTSVCKYRVNVDFIGKEFLKYYGIILLYTIMLSFRGRKH